MEFQQLQDRAKTAKAEDGWILSLSALRKQARDWSLTERRKIVFELQSPDAENKAGARPQQAQASTTSTAGGVSDEQRRAEREQAENLRDGRFERAVDRWVRLAVQALDRTAGDTSDEDYKGGVRVSAWTERAYRPTPKAGEKAPRRLVWEYDVVHPPSSSERQIPPAEMKPGQLDRVQQTLQDTLVQETCSEKLGQLALAMGEDGTMHSSRRSDVDEEDEDSSSRWKMYVRQAKDNGRAEGEGGGEEGRWDWEWVELRTTGKEPRPGPGSPASSRRSGVDGDEDEDEEGQLQEQEPDDPSRPIDVSVFLGSVWPEDYEPSRGGAGFSWSSILSAEHRKAIENVIAHLDQLDRAERVVHNLHGVKEEFVTTFLEEMGKAGPGGESGTSVEGEQRQAGLENLIGAATEGAVGVALGGVPLAAAGMRAGLVVAPAFLAAIGKLKEQAAEAVNDPRTSTSAGGPTPRPPEDACGVVGDAAGAAQNGGEAAPSTSTSFCAARASNTSSTRTDLRDRNPGGGNADTFQPEALREDDRAGLQQLIKSALAREIARQKREMELSVQKKASDAVSAVADSVREKVGAEASRQLAQLQAGLKNFADSLDSHPELLDELAKTLSACDQLLSSKPPARP